MRKPDFRDSLMYDLYVRENIKSRPSFASDQSPYKKEVREFFMAEEENPKWLTDYAGFDSRQMAKMAHLEHMEDGMRRPINRAYFTMVALDEDDKPKQVPRLILETEAQRAEWKAAEKRREMRMRRKEEGF